MNERRIFRSGLLPREILVIDAERERKAYLLKCSRRKLGQLLEAVAGPGAPEPPG